MSETVKCERCGCEHDPMAWCRCTPTNVIAQHELRHQMFFEGFDPDSEEDQKAYAAAHYGRHDRKFLGVNAIAFPVPQIMPDDRIPEGLRRSTLRAA